MKKIVSLAIAGFLALGLGACGTGGNDGQQDGDSQQVYKDGIYEGAAEPWDHGAESATVEIADGKIKSIVLKRLDTDGVEVDYEDWKGQEIDGRLYPDLNKYRTDMANDIIKKQSYDVDTISGATTTTKNWKVSVQKALEKAR